MADSLGLIVYVYVFKDRGILCATLVVVVFLLKRRSGKKQRATWCRVLLLLVGSLSKAERRGGARSGEQAK